MRNVLTAGAVLAAASVANADLCSIGSELIGGNWYCQAVKAITYQNFGGSGTYNQITNMDSTTGACSSQPQSYSGSLAPLNEEVSIHIRGPAQLKQFAAYTPGSSSTSSSKKAKRSPHERRHAHAHGHAKFHERANEVREAQEKVEERGVGDWVTAVMNGKTVSWINEYSGAASTPAPVASPQLPVNPVAGINAVASVAAEFFKPAPSAVAQSKPSATPSAYTPTATGDWIRTAYYNSESQSAQGVTFLNNNGGSGSGTFDMTFGNSLSYASADGCSGAASPQVLEDTTIPSNKEVIIFSDKQCSGNSCGYSRPDTVAYHGFGGSEKIFLLEFSFPDDGTTGWNMNMPAIWMLNAQIPRTLQYGSADCSCWQSGCGEFDLFEVLASGDTRCKSTLHGNISGGDSDYFERPVSGTIKAAVVMANEQAHIRIIDDSYAFATALTSGDVSDLSATDASALDNLLSIFTLG